MEEEREQPPPGNNVSEETETAWVLVASARKVLAQGNGIEHLKGSLRKKIHLLDQKRANQVHAGGFEDVILEGWVEELLRFLALKTLLDDTTKPFQLASGGPIAIAWKELMVMPTQYANVCYSMGNANVIDHDPFDAVLNEEEERHMQKRLNVSMRVYQKYFDEDPPRLFWKENEEAGPDSPLSQVLTTVQDVWNGASTCTSSTLMACYDEITIPVDRPRKSHSSVTSE